MRIAALLVLLGACDPALNMSSAPLMKRTVEHCPEAVARLRQCCPQYESFVSCTVMEKYEGWGDADLSAKQSRCLKEKDCGEIEKAVVSEKKVCGVEFRGHLCR